MGDVDEQRPEHASPDLPPGSLIDPASSHLADRRGDGYVITETSAPVVYLSPARRRFLAEAADRRETSILVSGESTVLSPAYAEVAELVRSRWVVAGPEGVRDARIGRRLDRPEDVFGRAAGMERALEHARPPGGEVGVQVAVNASIRHRNPAKAEYGVVLDALTSTVMSEVVMEWGVAEPVNVTWNADDVADYVRANLRQGPWLLVAGEDGAGRPIAASLRYRATKQGSEEIVSLIMSAGERGTDGARAAMADVVTALEAIAHVGTPLFAVAMARYGRTDLNVAPTMPLPSAPLAILFGAPAVSRFGRDLADLEAATDGTIAGARRRESLIVPVGDSIRAENVDRLRDVLWAVDPVVVADVAGPGVVDGVLGPDWRAEADARRAAMDAADPRDGEQPLEGSDVDAPDLEAPDVDAPDARGSGETAHDRAAQDRTRRDLEDGAPDAT